MVNIIEANVKQIRGWFESGDLSSYDLVKEYLRRIAEIDQSGPSLNSVIEINPDALFLAKAMDRERANGKVRSPLHGMPVLLKDNINTADKLRTSSGSLSLEDNFAPYDASLVKKLRAAGLIILGKTNMTEFANFMSTSMKNGYSSRGGQTLNPYNLEADVSGSSSGSAVAIAANLCLFSVGTETNGSIIGPSQRNSIVGIKPTLGLISRHGILPICTSQDTAGPMARTVQDCAELLNVMVGPDEADPASWATESYIPADYTKFLDKDGLKSVRVGINRAYSDHLFDDRRELFDNAIADIRACGAEVVEDVSLSNFRSDKSILLYEFKKCLNAYLATVNTSCRSLADIIKFFEYADKAHPKYGMDILRKAQYQTSGDCTEPEYINDKLNALRLSQEEGLDKIFEDHKIDILISPGITDHAPISGYPAITVPIGYDSANIPFGISFLGRPFTEPLLIGAAHAYEQTSQKRRAPAY